MEYISHSPDETEAIGQSLGQHLKPGTVLAYLGNLGIGKTAFTRGFASHFGITAVKSPTYTVLNEYRGRCKIHHFDFYRITDGDDLYSIGYDDIIEEDGYTLGEWSENIVDFLPEDAIRVTISRLYTDENATAEQLMLRRIDVDYGELFE